MKDKKLRIVKRLPQIYLPENKKEMFLKWYDEDLRFQDEIPKTFERGYLLMDNMFEIGNSINNNEALKRTAVMYKITYRQAENMLKEFLEECKEVVIYFEFKQNFLYMELYFKKKLINTIDLDLLATEKDKPNPKIIEKIFEMFAKNKNLYSVYGYQALVYLECVLWYLATTTKTTKYYREGEKNSFYYEKKEVINPKKNKYITTPIYDMSKIRKVKVEGLIKRRKGWTYSHSFQVHGHYRHYKDGKTIFIEPYIKGKGKEEISQKIIINPKEE